jgi:hypothetical protein
MIVRKSLAALAIAGTILLSGCAGAPESSEGDLPNQSTSDQPQDNPGEATLDTSMSPISLGMTEADVIAALEANAITYDRTVFTPEISIYFETDGMTISVGREGVDQIATNNESLSTQLGIRTGSTMDEVLEAYGEPTDRQDYDLDGIYLGSTWEYFDGRTYMRFEFSSEDDAVETWVVSTYTYEG